MEPTVFFNTIWPTLSVLVVVPTTQWIKSMIPGDWPISSQLVVVVMNGVIIYVAKELTGMEIPIEEMWPYLTGAVAFSNTAHAMVKTKKKNNL